MPKSQTPRKAYRPRAIRCNPVLHGIQGAATVASHPTALQIQVHIHDALASIANNIGTLDNASTLLGVCSITQALNDIHLGSPVITQAADDALDQIMTLHQQTGQITVTPQQLTALQDLLALYEQQMAVTPISKFEAALDLAERRVKQQQRTTA